MDMALIPHSMERKFRAQCIDGSQTFFSPYPKFQFICFIIVHYHMSLLPKEERFLGPNTLFPKNIFRGNSFWSFDENYFHITQHIVSSIPKKSLFHCATPRVTYSLYCTLHIQVREAFPKSTLNTEPRTNMDNDHIPYTNHTYMIHSYRAIVCLV